MARTLSKSRFQKGLQCEKALWLGVHRPDLATPVSEATQWVFDQGSEVGRVAHGLLPGGVEVTEDFRHQAEALVTTERLLAEGARVLYEPAFAYGGAFARVDILVAAGHGTWDLYEVKSSGSLKPEHVTDAAVQAWTAEGSGLTIGRIFVVHLNTAYVWPGGAYDPAALFTIEDVTTQARAFMPSIPATLDRLRSMLEGGEPEVEMGRRCTSPYACDFIPYCRRGLPAAGAVTGLPGLSDEVLHALLRMGITRIADVPPAFPGLTAAGRDAVAVVASGRPRVDAAGLAGDLAVFEWPVYHLDFETVMPALPLWPGTRPYQAIPFQYSVHIHHPDGSSAHRAYLHEGAGDPRRPLVQQMLADLGNTGSVLHYSSYERTRLLALAAELPDLAPALEAVVARLIDLLPIVRRRMRHPGAPGGFSIKQVLPAWCPDLSYDGLEVADGQTASVRYLGLVTGRITGEEAEAARENLLRYCALDTFAMVRLLETMRELSQDSGS